jgi:Na+/proline symporter
VLPLRFKNLPLSCPPQPPITLLTDLGLGSGILFSYPELATIAGVQGVITYALMSALPLLIFAALGPIIRRKCPEGFVLTEWTRQRYGVITALWLSFLTLVTMFLYMVSELSAIGQVVSTLTGLDSLPVLIVQCVVTTIYTCELSWWQTHLRRFCDLTPYLSQLSAASKSPSSRTTSKAPWC